MLSHGFCIHARSKSGADNKRILFHRNRNSHGKRPIIIRWDIRRFDGSGMYARTWACRSPHLASPSNATTIENRASSESLWYRFTRYLPQNAASIARSRLSTASSLSHKPIGMVINQCHCFDLMKSTKASLYGLSDLRWCCSVTL